jgi:hypothetical protein
MGHMFVSLLLAQFRVPQLYHLILAICEYRSDVLDVRSNDFIIDDLPGYTRNYHFREVGVKA